METLNIDTPETFGCRWETEAVSAVFGENNQSDKRVVNPTAQILVIVDLDVFRATFGDKFLIAMSDGTSLRVICQRIGRKHNGKDNTANRKAVIDSINGIRTRGASVTTKRPLPNGTFYHGTDETEYRQSYIAALVELDTPVTLAQAIVARLPF